MDGRELFFLSIDGRQIYGVSLETALTIEPARVLAEGNFLPSLGPERHTTSATTASPSS